MKRRHYEIARGSAVESIAVLDLASALGVVDGSANGLATARALFTRVAMMLARLTVRFGMASSCAPRPNDVPTLRQ